MAMNTLVARDRGATFYVKVHLDTTKLDAQGNPDPAWCRDFTYGSTPPPGVTLANYKVALRNEVRLLCQDILAALTVGNGTALPFEGQAP